MDRIKNEPALLAVLVQVITVGALKLGLHLDAGTITWVAGGLAAALGVAVRSVVRPTRKPAPPAPTPGGAAGG